MAVKSFTLRLPAVIAVIVLAMIVAVVIRWWIHSDAVAMESACIHHLAIIDSIKHEWALEDRIPESSNATPTWGDLALSLQSNDADFSEASLPGSPFRFPKYPPNATYTIGPMSDSPTCSYSGHTFALYGLRIQVGDGSITTHDGHAFDVYKKQEWSDGEVSEVYKGIGRPEWRLRPAGSIAGATVTVLDGTDHPTKLTTGEDGTAYLKVFSGQPVALIVSKDGFFAQSNSIRDPYQYDYNILLKAKPNENVQKAGGTVGPSAPVIARPLMNLNEPKSTMVTHAYAEHQLRLPPTPAYDQAVAHSMIAEASRTANDLQLAETLPITETNVSIYLDTLAAFIHNLELGKLQTGHYIYWFSAGTTVSGIEHKHLTANLKHKAEHTWSTNRPDTNAALAIANQIMETCGVDMSAINHDCTSDITVPIFGGPPAHYFGHDYFINWNVTGTNVLFDDLPDQSSAAIKRKLWPAQSPSGKMMAASLQFIEPTRQIWSFHVYDPKCIEQRPLESLDIVKLLSQGDSEEAVLYEMKIATNAAARREAYKKAGAPMSVLKGLGLESTNNSAQTNGSP